MLKRRELAIRSLTAGALAFSIWLAVDLAQAQDKPADPASAPAAAAPTTDPATSTPAKPVSHAVPAEVTAPVASSAGEAPAPQEAVAPTAEEEAVAPIDANAVLSYLEEMSNWYGTIQSLETTATQSRTGLYKDALKQNGLNALQYSFDFGAAQATILDRRHPLPASPDAAGPPTNHQQLTTIYTTVNARVESLQKSLAGINAKLRSARGKQRSALSMQRDKQTDELSLVQAQQDLLKTMVGLVKTTATDEAGGMAGKVATMRRTVPDLNPAPAAAATTATSAGSDTASSDNAKAAITAATGMVIPSTTDATTTVITPAWQDDDGILNIVGELYSQSRKRDKVVTLLEQTQSLRETTAHLRLAVRNDLRAAANRGNQIAASQTEDNTALNQQRKELKSVVGKFRRLAGAMVPLGQTDQRLEAADHTLREWRDSFKEDTNRLARRLGVRLGILAIGIMIPLIISEIVRRATNRYVADPRRQRQLRIVRRVLVGGILLLVIVINLVSEISSFATFIGFLTAGLAVALQNVLLSLVAHFFFFGRYGVRAGDRVSVNGITGDVLQVGMMRLYLAELERDANGEFKPSGRMVAFPNSILFQPTAFFKQVKQ